MELSEEQLQKMASADLNEVRTEDLTDFRDFQFDFKKDISEKLTVVTEQTKNVYVGCRGDYVIKVIHPKNAPSINDRMEEYLRKLAKNLF